MLKPKPPPLPANFAALRRYAYISHSVAHSREPHYPNISREDLLEQQSAYDVKLTEAILEVRRRIMDEEMALSTLHSRRTISDSKESPLAIPKEPQQKLRKLKVLKSAHDQCFNTIDYIPSADSPLNILLAFRSVEIVIAQTITSIRDVEERIKSVQTLLKSQNAAATEQNRLMEALRARLDVLLEEQQQINVGADIVGQGDLIRKVGKKKKEVAKRTNVLLRELLYFLDNGLARMVAAEEMGGPVVGDDLDVTLETGFSKQGNVKKGNHRIDEMWGQAEEHPEKKMVLEFKGLLEGLLNAWLETSSYVELEKDSAAARFLVRAKVAVFHPKDARKLKLLDFGSNVEDS